MKNRKHNTIGIILTVIITIGFIGAIYRLTSPNDEKKTLTHEEIRTNERMAYENLKTIAAAQEKYKQKDWDNDGKKEYAMFYVHLWKSVPLTGKPIDVNLIAKELAFAMEESNPLKGYYYMNLHQRRTHTKTHRELDYKKEWAVAAIPGNKEKTGRLTFIADQSSGIYATTKIHIQPQYPQDPGGNGWTRLDSREDLEKLQERTSYPDY